MSILQVFPDLQALRVLCHFLSEFQEREVCQGLRVGKEQGGFQGRQDLKAHLEIKVTYLMKRFPIENT